MAGIRQGAFGLLLALLVVLVFARIMLPSILVVQPDEIPGPDAPEYVHLSAALLHGSYLVDYDGPPRPTRYTPGFPLLLMPVIAIGGFASAVWVSYFAALVLSLLAALLAWRVGGGLAPAPATALVLFNGEMFFMSRVIMSDLPSTTMAFAEVALLALAGGRFSAVAAGLLAGALVWVRPGSIVLVVAAIAGLSAVCAWKHRLVWYTGAVTVPVLLLACFQWYAFGSPLVTSYQATAASGDGSTALSSFLSVSYILGPPWNAYMVGSDSNLSVYLRALIGLDNPETLPGIGLLGLIGAAALARRTGPGGCFGRFTLAANVVTLLLYVPYFFRDVRFLMIPVSLNDVAAAVMIAGGISRLASALPTRRRQVTQT
jgi:hypothetical protein